MANISEWGWPKKIIAVVILILIIWLGWRTFFGVNQATRAILDLPEMELELENADGELISISVRNGTPATTYVNVDPDVIRENVVYYTSNFPASATRIIRPVQTDLQIARFGPDGHIQEIYDVPADTEVSIVPDGRYQHTIMAYDGFFAEHGISVENETSIVID